VFVNAGGPKEESMMGNSQVAMPFLGPISHIETAEEGMRLVNVDMEILEKAEKDYKSREDMGRADWHYQY